MSHYITSEQLDPLLKESTRIWIYDGDLPKCVICGRWSDHAIYRDGPTRSFRQPLCCNCLKRLHVRANHYKIERCVRFGQDPRCDCRLQPGHPIHDEELPRRVEEGAYACEWCEQKLAILQIRPLDNDPNELPRFVCHDCVLAAFDRAKKPNSPQMVAIGGVQNAYSAGLADNGNWCFYDYDGEDIAALVAPDDCEPRQIDGVWYWVKMACAAKVPTSRVKAKPEKFSNENSGSNLTEPLATVRVGEVRLEVFAGNRVEVGRG